MRKLFLTALIFITSCVPQEDKDMDVQTGLQSSQLNQLASVSYSCSYLLFVPHRYNDTDEKFPLILFLHGAGERGSDLEKVKLNGPPKIALENRDFNFIVVAPQCPEDKWWTEQTDLLISLLDDVISRYRVDTDRIYLTGLSMGGFGTWELACRYPDRFAAVAPICGGGYPYLAYRLRNTPVWAFHGEKDNIVPLGESSRMVDAVNKFGGSAKLTTYPDAGHDSWTEAYADPALYEWFLSHKRYTPSSGETAR